MHCMRAKNQMRRCHNSNLEPSQYFPRGVCEIIWYTRKKETDTAIRRNTILDLKMICSARGEEERAIE